MKQVFMLGVVLFLLVKCASAQPPVDTLTATLSRQYITSNFPGFCVSLVRGSRIIYQHGFGYADLRYKLPYTLYTVQPVGSVSKTLIGIALMKANELGYLSLDTPINQLLPFQVFNPYFPHTPITVRQLATHTSGIIDSEQVYEKTYLFGKSKTNVPLKTFLEAYLTKKGKLYRRQNYAPAKPGTSFHYTNIGATLAAYLIETKAKMPFSMFTSKYILKPLRMRHSAWFDSASNSATRATLYNPQYTRYPQYASITYPDGSLRTSCHDLSLYLLELMRGSRGGSQRLLSRKSFRQMITPQFLPSAMPGNVNEREPNQGIFFVFRRDGSIGHTGSDYGVSAFLFFNPKTNIGKIFMTNIDIQENEKLAKQFASIWKTLDKAVPFPQSLHIGIGKEEKLPRKSGQ